MSIPEDDFELETDYPIAYEYNVRERCQHLAISLENVRFRVGIDRFKWISLILLLKLKMESSMFDDEMIDDYFNKVIPKIPKLEYRNPLACVLVYYISLNKSNFNYVKNELYSQQSNLFQEYKVRIEDLVRYIRLFQSTFSSFLEETQT